MKPITIILIASVWLISAALTLAFFAGAKKFNSWEDNNNER